MTGVLHMESRIEMNEKAIDHPGSISMNGNIYMQEANNGEKHSITGLKDPDASSDSQNSYAISKGFADGRYLNKAGGITTGAINMGDANQSNSMSYPLYFGEDENTYIKRNGVGQLYIHNDNNIDFNNQRLTRVASPEQSTDAANKAYVDSSALSGGGLLIKFNTQVERADRTYDEIVQAIEQDIKIELRASNTAETVVRDYKLGQYHAGAHTIGFYNITTPTTSIEDLTNITLSLLQLKLSGETETWTSKTYQISLT